MYNMSIKVQESVPETFITFRHETQEPNDYCGAASVLLQDRCLWYSMGRVSIRTTQRLLRKSSQLHMEDSVQGLLDTHVTFRTACQAVLQMQND